jgi:hypothetical protein
MSQFVPQDYDRQDVVSCCGPHLWNLVMRRPGLNMNPAGERITSGRRRSRAEAKPARSYDFFALSCQLRARV